MDVGDSWPGVGCPGPPKDTTIINKMMLRFRPIAPKPVDNSSGSGSMLETQKMEVVGKRRTKRKYVRVKNSSKCKNKEQEKESKDHGTIVTLQLLPESSGGVKCSSDERSYQETINFLMQDKPIWMNFHKSESHNILSIGAPNMLDRTMDMRSTSIVESWVMVDGITNTLVDVSAIGSTDTEKMKCLESDTCPGLVSDGLESVKWMNSTYQKMIHPPEDGGPGPPSSELKVWLIVKEKENAVLLPAFACTVRIVYTWNKVKQSRTMPCDVWKMDFGGFAWRFDAKAALSLGL